MGLGGTPQITVDCIPGTWQDLTFGKKADWAFVGEPWTGKKDGLIAPPPYPWNTGGDAYTGQESNNEEILQAYHTGAAYGDFEAEFGFRWDAPHCGAGFIFRARDQRHYYLAHFPCIAQCVRAEHFWVAISKVGDTGWTEVLEMEMLHGVAGERQMWHQARVVSRGNTLQVWVDGRPSSIVRDDTCAAAGAVGLEAWGHGNDSVWFRNLRIRGEAAGLSDWDATMRPVKNWFLPVPGDGEQQSVPGMTRAPNGELLMAIEPGSGLVRSTDNARTWSPVEAAEFPGGWLHTTAEGGLMSLCRFDGELCRSESSDNGNSWSKPELVQRAPFKPPENAPDMRIHGPGGFLALDDGTLLGFHVGSLPDRGHDGGFHIQEWGQWAGYAAYSTRSTDAGRTWSAPVPLNGPPAIGQKYDLCECDSTVQTGEGRILCLVRPVYSPWMWEIWSDDQGKSWSPAMSGPFPCYAATALATASGVILVSGRMPGLGLYASFDSGMTWRAYRVDTGGLWAMGRMYEVEPGLVFYPYMDLYGSSLRAQFIRVSDDSVEPVRNML